MQTFSQTKFTEDYAIRKCLSSSITLHLEHSLSYRGVLGLVCMPRSISRGWELDRIFVIAFRYLESFTKSRFVSK